MSETLPSNYNYPHKNGVVSDEVLHDDRHANPDKYHDDLLPYIDDYLHRKNEQKIDSRLGDEMLAVSTEVLEREEKASVATEFAADALAGVVHRNEQSPASPQIQSVFKRLDAVVEMGENASYNEVESLRQGARNIARFDVDWYHESAQEVGVYLQKLVDFNKQAGHMGGEVSSFAIDSLADTIPGDILSKAYKENDAVHSAVDEILNGVEPSRENLPKLTAALSRVYGTMRDLNYLVTGQDALVDKLRRRFPVDYAIETIQEEPEQLNNPESIQIHDRDVRRKIVETMAVHLGLPTEMVVNYWKAAYSRLSVQHTYQGKMSQYLDGHRVKESLRSMQSIVEAVGVDRLLQINDKFGIVNLDRYRPEDIELLGKLVDKDKATLDYLRSGDVTAVLTDAYGDHNGAFNKSFLYFTQESGRTVPFEISQPSDLYRRMIALRDLGISPSTVVVGAHGEPGAMLFGEEIEGASKDTYGAGNGFAAVSSGEWSGQYDGVALDVSKMQLHRLTDEFMKDSKGLDDGKEVAGRRRLILLSCSSDVEYSKNVKSMAEVIVKESHNNKLDVYGSSDVLVYRLDEEGDVQFYSYAGLNTQASTLSGKKLSRRRFFGDVKRTEAAKVFRKTL